MSMKLAFMNTVALVLLLGIALQSEVCHAKPFGNHWHPSDSRCAGGSFPGIRLRRSVSSNNFGSTCYKFNPNHDSCDKMYECSNSDYQTFESQSECERKCLDVYHF